MEEIPRCPRLKRVDRSFRDEADMKRQLLAWSDAVLDAPALRVASRLPKLRHDAARRGVGPLLKRSYC